MKAVILAGGRGRRLEPYTSVLPKPLMPVGDRAIIEVIIDRLSESGITDVTLCVGYLGHLIQALLNGRAGGTTLRYVHEDEPLGTAGPLRLLDLDETFISMNGDLLTTLDYRDLVDHHRRAGNLLTIAGQERAQTLDYGVIHVDNAENLRLVEYEEKPVIKMTVSMGIYVMEPEVLKHVPSGYFDFPDLVQALLAQDLLVGTYPFSGLWLDIGRRDDYEEAIDRWERTISESNA